jgi:hypothetical protein
MDATRKRRIVLRTLLALVLFLAWYLASAPFVQVGIGKFLPVNGVTIAAIRFSNIFYGPISWYAVDQDRPGVRAYISYMEWCVRLMNGGTAPTADPQTNELRSNASGIPPIRRPR